MTNRKFLPARPVISVMAIDEKRQSQRRPATGARETILATAEPRSRRLPADEVGAGILLVEPGRGLLVANRFACLLLGYPREELLAIPPEELFVAPPAHEASVLESGTARLRRKDGAEVVVRYEARDVSLGPVRLNFWLVYPRRLLGEAPQVRSHQRPVELTPRELEILQLLADGCDNDAVSQHLQISRETVKSHVRRLLQKLGANSRTHAVAIALRDSLVV